MSKKIGIPAVGVAMLLVVTGNSTADHLVRGEYKSEAADDRLFVEGGRVLGADLFFSTPDMDTVVAPKGSEIMQSVPAVVWQYSALLPVSDYLRSAVIHSVGSDEKIRPWQDVQTTFYNGLLVEGVREMDAKIAYAGAYGFSPRWALVEFTRIEEAVPAYQDTELYSIAYIQPANKGMTLEAYRRLSLEILQRPEDFTLEDIKVAIDAADSTGERVSLDGIDSSSSLSNVRVTNENSVPSDLTEGVEVSAPRVVIELTQDPAPAATGTGVVIGDDGNLLHSDSKIVTSTGDDALPSESGKDVEEEIPVEVAPVPDQSKLSTVPAEIVTANGLFIENEILSSSGALAPSSERDQASLGGSEDEWMILPDGTLVLRSTTRLASE